MRQRLALAATLSALLAGCALTPAIAPLNHPARSAAPVQPGNDLAARAVVRGERLIMLSFSGGGMRAAAFAAGVLQGLQAMVQADGSPMIDQVGFISSVSGGSLTAAWFRLHGEHGLPRIRDELLLRDGESDLRLSLLNPLNLMRLAGGGLNDRSTLYRWLDQDVFAGASFADLMSRNGPVVWINATYLLKGTAFPFHERSFDAICSDLASLPVAEAVAASMAVPLVFAPVTLRTYPGHCGATLPDWADTYDLAFGEGLLRRRLLAALQDFRRPGGPGILQLVDGGVSDNIGLTALVQSRWLLGTPQAPFSESDALRLHHLLFLVVDAGQGGGDTTMAVPIRATDIGLAALNATIDANARLSFDTFRTFLEDWRASITRWRCAQTRHAAGCDRLQFELSRLDFDSLPAETGQALRRIPTSLRLSAEEVDALLAAGRHAVQRNIPLQRWRQRPGP